MECGHRLGGGVRAGKGGDPRAPRAPTHLSTLWMPRPHHQQVRDATRPFDHSSGVMPE